MLLLKSIKVLFISAFAASIFSSCQFWQKPESETPAPTPLIVEDLKSDALFSGKEPENFQAEFVVTTNGKTDKTFVARNGGNRHFDYNFGEKNQFSNVQTADGKDFLIYKDKKIYAESLSDTTISNAENPFDFLTSELLNQKTGAKFEKLGAEGDLMKYRAVFGDSGNSEALIWIDEKIGLPVKQEFYSIGGEQKTLNFAFEMKNFKPQTDKDLFEIPTDFRKISIEEFRKNLQSEN